jgi:ElaB/YqjD/DUF883 family membrane-anchored ribosome-binding protein
MSTEQQSLEEEQLNKEIQELRSDLGETVEVLVHKADLPARAKERGNELKEEAIERGNKLKALAAERGSELRDRAIDAADRTREAVGQTPTTRWAKLAAAGVAMITLVIIAGRVRRS